MSQALEFNWGKAGEQFTVGHGSVSTAGGEVNFAVKRPHELVSLHPMVVVPGFTDGLTGLNRLTNAYAEARRFAVALEHPRADHPDYEDDPEGHKADNIRVVFEAISQQFPELEAADLQGHSDGGSNGSRFALEHPEAVRSLIVMASGGLIAGDTQLRIIHRAVTNPELLLEWTKRIATHPLFSAQLIGSSLGFIRRHPQKAIEEAAFISSADIRPRFPVLSQSGPKRVPNGAIQFKRDVLFPLDMVLDSTDNGKIFDLFEIFPDHSAGHLAPQDHPRKVAGLVLKMVDDLQVIKATHDVAA